MTYNSSTFIRAARYVSGHAILVLMFVAGMALSVTASSVQLSGWDHRASVGDPFWSAVRFAGDEVEGYATLDEMEDYSDVVLRGHMVDLRVSRQVTYDAEEDIVTYVAADFVPTDEIRGSAMSGSTPIEFMINAPPERVSEVVAKAAARLPADDLVVFLRHKLGQGETGLFRLVNQAGLWKEEGAMLTAPLSEHSESSKLTQSSTLDDLVAKLRQQ